jgi:Domain of unknown function (DUF6457)
MEAWIDRLAEALGEEALTKEEANVLLGAARDVAHRVERKITPLAAFVLGSSVGRAVSQGASRSEALRRALETTEGLLPPPEG